MADTTRRTVMVPLGDTVIETIAEGTGPALVMLPSLGRDGYEDFDEVAGMLAAGGLSVLRPQPRGVGGSNGKMEGASLHDLAADIAAVITAEGGGRAVILGHAFGHFVARMTAVDFATLVHALSGASGTEAWIALRDVCRLEEAEAERVSALTVSAILDRLLPEGA